MLGNVILLTLLALGLFVIAWVEDHWVMPARLILALGGIIFLALAIAAAWLWIQDNAVKIVYRRNQAEAMSGPYILLDRLSKMSESQLALVDQYVNTIEFVSGDAGPLRLLRVGSGKYIPMDFVEYYVNLTYGDMFYPIRELQKVERLGWSVKSQQEWASLFVNHAYTHGWCELFAGNQPAKWVDWPRARKALWG